MYDKLVLDKINNLPYLKATPKSNVTIISKKNAYGDVVKFFAQINKNDVIQKFSFKATGCTHFVVYCDYFCSLVEGKSVDESLKLGKDDLEQLEALTESKLHVVKIILDTFALLIKKYRKGISAGTIEAVEVSESTQTTKKTTKKVSKNIEVEDITITTTKRKENSKTSTTKQEVIASHEELSSDEVSAANIYEESSRATNKSEVVEQSVESRATEVVTLDKKKTAKLNKKAQVEESKSTKTTKVSKLKAEKLDSMNSKRETKSKLKENKVATKEDKQKEKLSKLTEKQSKIKRNKKAVEAETIEVVEAENNMSVVSVQSEPVDTVVVSNAQGATVRHKVEKTTRITRVATENDELVAMERHEVTQTHSIEQNNNSVKQASNIMALKAMIHSSKNSSNENSKEDKKVQQLSSMIDSIKSKNQKAVEEKEHAERISSIRNNIERLNRQSSTQKVEQNVSEEISDEVIVEEPKKKKGLFGWLKKK